MEIRSSVALALLSLAAATARQGPACSRSRCPGAVAAAGPAGAPRGASFRGRSPADRGLIPGASRGERARLLQGTLRLRGGQTVDKSARDKDEESRGKEARRKRKQSSGGGAGRAADNEGASDAGAAVGSRDSTSAVPAQGHGTVAGKGEPPGQEEEEEAAVGGAGGSGPRLMFGVSCYTASPKQRRLTHTHDRLADWGRHAPQGNVGGDFPNKARLDELYREAAIFTDELAESSEDEHESSGDGQGNSPFEVASCDQQRACADSHAVKGCNVHVLTPTPLRAMFVASSCLCEQCLLVRSRARVEKTRAQTNV